jgi:AmmeMemoRadiSam system protein A
MKANQNSKHRLTQKLGQALIALARNSIAERIALNFQVDEALYDMLEDKRLKAKSGTFVTLNKKGTLRGCIGSLTPSETIVESVKRNAINAAFHDYRFDPLTPTELDDVEIELSILTEPEVLKYEDPADLISKLKPGEDGVIIRFGASRATFLPQVWKQLPDPQDFLNHLCLKAGLAADAWQTSKLEVLIYQVQYFEEKK